MYRAGDSVVYSPSDLTEFMESRFASWMSRLAVERPRTRPAEGQGNDAADRRLLQKHGEAHEVRVIEALRAEGHDLVEIEGGREEASARTLDAMREGRQVICQARLERGPFAGYADFLFKVDRPSGLGAHGYEVWEAKLARRPKPYFLVQLCAYAEMLREVQGWYPERVQIALGAGPRKSFRTEDFLFYFRALERDFLASMDAFDPDRRPLPDPRADHRGWQDEADRILEETDHVSRVAGISTGQIENLHAQQIDTIRGLAATGLVAVPRIQPATFERLKDQAQLQAASLGEVPPRYRVLKPGEDDPHKGLAILPPGSPLDVWFDIEGYPFAEGGLEYLFGASFLDPKMGDGALDYADWWAHDAHEERLALEGFVDWAHARWRRDPSMHIYHYAAYEVTALRRLMGRYGTRENEIDDLLRNHVFVDLYGVVRHGVRVGEPRYSLKNLESLYMGPRYEEITSGLDSIVQYEAWIESGESHDCKQSPLLDSIRIYNRVDCDSTKLLCDWLRERQAEEEIGYFPEPTREEDTRPLGDDVVERQQLAEAMLAAIPEDADERELDADRWRIQELLAHLVEFHRREDKPMWWAFFNRLAMTSEERAEDLDCLAELRRTSLAPFAIKRSTGVEYAFDPDQDTKLHEAGRCAIAQDSLGSVTLEELDREAGRAVVKFGPSKAIPDGAICLVPREGVRPEPIATSIAQTAARFESEQEIQPALRALLLREAPRVGGTGGALVREGEEPRDAVVRLVDALEESTLCIQGPPGSGKTTSGAAAILALLKKGKKVGITSNSHKAILNLMTECAEQAGGSLDCVKIGGKRDEPFVGKNRAARHVVSAADAAPMLDDVKLAGGTAWAFSHPSMAGQLDHLFVDEAGQVSVANLVGMARSAKNLVLLGDQMQLGQPIQGSHPGESGASVLEYLLQGHATIPPELGVFLDRTWRLHPELCDFISGAVYEGRLQAREANAQRVIRVPQEDAGSIPKQAGLLFVPVEHRGNTQGSDEEVERIVRLKDELLGREVTYTRDAVTGPLQLRDILFVAPYNMQVRKLEAALPEGARVGSVDLFQGQQAPVVIVSMCASDPASSPRGIEFLFNKNRLNVALSRAISLALVVGSPALAGGPCATIEQMSLSNLFCRIVEAGSAD
ncbi:MAG: TM0106 family RecB-like putative nuclease [Deltaproteobacteria bacterium]|nr:TM0106 family RecB-like putative nuclease [Deltaproteobacteria bacterium]